MPTIGAYVSEEFYEMANNLADENNLSVSKVVKQIFTSGEVKDLRAETELLYQIARIGKEMNEISKKCNIFKAVDKQVLFSLSSIESKLDVIVESLALAEEQEDDR